MFFFIFSDLIYFVHLLLPWETAKTQILVKLNKIMKISQEDEILIKNLSKQYGARRLLSELPDKGWKLASIDSLLKKICRTGTLSGNHAAVDRVQRV